MKPVLFALVAGLLFGLGLVVGGMTDPSRVLGFLDVAGGAWDPTLAFVMGGAVMTTLVGFRLVMKRAAPACAPHFHLPTRKDVDSRLLAGSALFGIGWGLVGLCPGPALANLGVAFDQVGLFVLAMIAGAGAFELLPKAKAAPTAA